jgi:hypothetical protein
MQVTQAHLKADRGCWQVSEHILRQRTTAFRIQSQTPHLAVKDQAVRVSNQDKDLDLRKVGQLGRVGLTHQEGVWLLACPSDGTRTVRVTSSWRPEWGWAPVCLDPG